MLGQSTLIKILGGLLALVAIVSLAYCQGRSDGKTGVEKQIEQAKAAAHKLNLEASEKAATGRIEDLKADTKQEQEDAILIAENPGGTLPPSSVALACSSLVRAGYSGSDLPAECGSASGN